MYLFVKIFLLNHAHLLKNILVPSNFKCIECVRVSFNHPLAGLQELTEII